MNCKGMGGDDRHSNSGSNGKECDGMERHAFRLLPHSTFSIHVVDIRHIHTRMNAQGMRGKRFGRKCDESSG